MKKNNHISILFTVFFVLHLASMICSCPAVSMPMDRNACLLFIYDFPVTSFIASNANNPALFL